jgi:hypothetical protein
MILTDGLHESLNEVVQGISNSETNRRTPERDDKTNDEERLSVGSFCEPEEEWVDECAYSSMFSESHPIGRLKSATEETLRLFSLQRQKGIREYQANVCEKTHPY